MILPINSSTLFWYKIFHPSSIKLVYPICHSHLKAGDRARTMLVKRNLSNLWTATVEPISYMHDDVIYYSIDCWFWFDN